MMRSTLLASVVLAVAAVVPGTAAAAPGPALIRDGATQPAFSYADAIRETTYVEIPFDRDRDGRRDRVAADVIRPRTGAEVPVIMAASPYYRCCGRGTEAELKAYGPDGDPTRFPLFYDNYFVPRGYAVVLVDLPGTNRSTGCLDVGGRSEVLGAKAVVDWLNGRAAGFRADGTPVRAGWSTGAVGMIGKSWDGAIANGVAATGVDGLRTVVPIEAISSWYDYERSQGLVLYGDTGGYVGIDADGPDDPCRPVADRINAVTGADGGDYTPFWAERDYRRSAARVRASVFLVHGLGDLNVRTNQLQPWWEALGAAGVHRKLWLTRVGHVDPFDVRRAEWVRTLHRWFDSELYGVRNGIRAEPPVTRETAPGVTVRERTWPAVTTPVTLRTGAGPGPDRLGGGPAATRSFTDDPTRTEDAMAADPAAPSGSRLVFLTPPLARDARLSGTATVTLRATVDRPSTPVTALLVDYGTATRVTVDPFGGDGIRRLGTESCWGAAAGPDDACYPDFAEQVDTTDLAVLARGLADAAHVGLRPGAESTLRWSLLPQDVVVPSGHRLGLVVAASDATLSLPDETGAARVTVRLGPSSVTLPVVGGTLSFR